MNPRYPTLEDYNQALQHPRTALTDPELSGGSVATTGLGLPLALCGGFALTYTVTAGVRKYAVRCFHKQSDSLEARYRAISGRLDALKSPYFLDFDFQPQGVRAGGGTFPVVKMAWASGETLGQFVEGRRRNSSELRRLDMSLKGLASYLEKQRVAHGDIQVGNVMVSGAGQKVQLIDYDGMFVEALSSRGSAELGHRNFQHPLRTQKSWDATLDRFSFIALSVALRALAAHPDLWDKTQSASDSAIVFTANDFADPQRSTVFSQLFGYADLAEDARRLAAICRSPYASTPSLEDFLAGRRIPKPRVDADFGPRPPAGYLPAFPVVDGTRFEAALAHVGDQVEVVGLVTSMREATTRDGRPYVFLNFGDWRGNIVRISIWSDGLAALVEKPNASWMGKWISVTGLMEPPYINKFGYSHLSININQAGQMHVIGQEQARYRLAAAGIARTEAVHFEAPARPSAQTRKGESGATPPSANELLVQSMRSASLGTGGAQTSSSGVTTPKHVAASKSGRVQTPSGSNWGCVWLVLVAVAIVTVLVIVATR